MMDWINHNGILVALVLFVFSTVVGSADKTRIPANWGFWKMWGFNAIQALGANASKFAEQSPVIQKLNATTLQADPAGNLVTTQTAISTTAASGGEVPKL